MSVGTVGQASWGRRHGIYTSRAGDKTPLCPPHEGRFESGYLDWIGCFSGVYGSSLARHCVIVTIRADSGPITRIEPGNPHKKDGSCDEKAKQQRTNIVQIKGTPSIDEYVSMLKLRTELGRVYNPLRPRG